MAVFPEPKGSPLPMAARIGQLREALGAPENSGLLAELLPARVSPTGETAVQEWSDWVQFTQWYE